MLTERVEFKNWEKIGIEYAIELWKNEEVTRYLSANGRFTDEIIEKRFKLEIENYKKDEIQYFPLFYRETGEFIGCCGLKKYVGELGLKFLEREISDLKDLYEMGFHILPKFWGKGIGEEVALKVIEYAFNKLEAQGIFAGHNPKNIKSKRLLNKLGFIEIGQDFYEPTGLMHPLYILKVK